jgi:hypothetical protein
MARPTEVLLAHLQAQMVVLVEVVALTMGALALSAALEHQVKVMREELEFLALLILEAVVAALERLAALALQVWVVLVVLVCNFPLALEPITLVAAEAQA